MSKNNVFHCLLKRELKESNPIKYHELVTNGSIDSYLDYKEIEIRDMLYIVEKQLREFYIPPKNKNQYNYTKYENTIKYITIEIVKNNIDLY